MALSSTNYCSTPSDLFEFIEEQLFQNEKFAAEGKRKLTTQIYGDPGIGKTSVLDQFPIKRLEKLNSEIISSYIPNFIVKYKINESIETQNKDIINNLNLTNKEKTNLTKDIYNRPDTKIVMVSQADIIVAEDISGLPSSDSEYNSLYKLYNLADIFQKEANSNEATVLKKFYLSKIERVLKQNAKDCEDLENEEVKNTIDRNVTKFDFTEWEKKVHDIHVNEPHIKHIILVLDDITRSAATNSAILNVLMPLFQQYTVGQRPLPKNCSVVITSNEEESESGQFNYVGQLDEAQTDRLCSTKVIFSLKDWQEHGRANGVHESIILFAEHTSGLFDPKKLNMTPRRMTQLGQALFNKFNYSSELFSDKVEQNKELLKTIYLQLGDTKNPNYQKVSNLFLKFLRDTGGEAMKFINDLKNGFDQNSINKINEFKQKGETVKINIIVHKLLDIINLQKIDKKFKEAIIAFFTEKDLLPGNLLFTFKRLQNEIVERWDNFKKGRDTSSMNKELFEQLSSIIQKVVPEIQKILVDMKKNADNVKSEINK